MTGLAHIIPDANYIKNFAYNSLINLQIRLNDKLLPTQNINQEILNDVNKHRLIIKNQGI